jgi:DNA-binding MarR family transcriptional regulator
MIQKVQQLPFLTDKQTSVLKFLYSYMSEYRYMPTRREVAKFLELKSDNATAYLAPLEKKGYLKRSGHTRRNLELTDIAYEKLNLTQQHETL